MRSRFTFFGRWVTQNAVIEDEYDRDRDQESLTVTEISPHSHPQSKEATFSRSLGLPLILPSQSWARLLSDVHLCRCVITLSHSSYLCILYQILLTC